MISVRELYEQLGELLKENAKYGELSVSACGADGCFRVVRDPVTGKATGTSIEETDYMIPYVEMAEELVYDTCVDLSDKDMECLVELCLNDATEEELIAFAEKHDLTGKEEVAITGPLTRDEVEVYMKANGYPYPEEYWFDIFMNAGEKQHLYDEVVRNGYELVDVDRWFHLMKVLGVEIPFEASLKIDGALYEQDIETLELNTPEEKTKEVDHLAAFIEVEVPYRIKEILELEGVSEDEISDLVDAVKNNTLVMFDYDGFDEFLENELLNIRGVELDHKEINSIKAELSVLRHDINGCAEFAPDLLPAKELRQAILELRLEAAMNGASLNLDEHDFIDLEHLDCFWYGGEIGSLEYKGYEVSIMAYGDVSVTLLDQNNDVVLDYRNKNGTGAYSNSEVWEKIANDDVLHKLSEDGSLVWSNNNWLELVIRDNEGNNVTPGNIETVLATDNVIEAFVNPKEYLKIIDEIIKEKNKSSLDSVIQDCESMNNQPANTSELKKMGEMSL